MHWSLRQLAVCKLATLRTHWGAEHVLYRMPRNQTCRAQLATSGDLHTFVVRQGAPFKAWDLSESSWDLCCPAVCSRSSDTCFAVANTKHSDPGLSQTLLQWSFSQPSGSVEQSATQTVLPSAVHSLCILPASSKAGSAPTAQQPQALVVYQDSSVALEPAVSNGHSSRPRPTDLSVEATSEDQGILAVLLSTQAEPALQLHTVQVCTILICTPAWTGSAHGMSCLAACQQGHSQDSSRPAEL